MENVPTPGWFKPTLDYFKDWLRPGVSVLDYGCGHGNLLRYDRARVINRRTYVGVDVDCWVLDKARREFPDVTFVDSLRKNCVYNPKGHDQFPDLNGRKFDFILAYSVFSHADLDDIKDTLRWMLQHLEDNGCIIVTVCDIQNAECIKWFRDRRIETYGSCEDVLRDQQVAYLVDNEVRTTPPTSVCHHFVSFFNIDWLVKQLPFNVTVGETPANWLQTPLIVTK